VTGHEAILQALGEASMCWNPTPLGVFDSERALKIAAKLEDLLGKPSVGEKVTGETSDGYHTFDELYEHRMALTAALCKAYGTAKTWRSKYHAADGEPMFEGFFIVGIELPTGTITYHYKLEHWDLFDNVPEWGAAPGWDGHTPADVVGRLNQWSKSN